MYVCFHTYAGIWLQLQSRKSWIYLSPFSPQLTTCNLFPVYRYKKKIPQHRKQEAMTIKAAVRKK